ncbi:YtxH domain-containing protein [Gilliamella sp. ESL0254]|uniref:YtxH domain-containing protein n=1 Tax=Gilliamella sp. ESL0254 TaxID=2705035 RepID=UPI001580CA52|nr:YtxH domain-containing protein [Gilliamella sp. ESL0254]NUF26634.1 YtxH domain-containing protein [Gilliamella sp. ESL0254]
MKLFKVISLAVVGLFLVNCDNSKSTANDMKQKAQQTGSEISDKANQKGSDVSEKAKQMASDLSDQAKQTSAAVSDKAKDLYEQTKSESEEIMNKLKDGNYSVAQDLVVKAIKTKLPVVVDQNTTLVDVSKGNNVIDYKYTVKDITKDALQTESNQKSVRTNLLGLYCSNNANMNTQRLVFPEGASHSYYINSEKVLTLDVKPSDCGANQ